MGEMTEYLLNFRRAIKLHETMLKEICEIYRLQLIEAKIICFLHNNPGKDTAADIVELRKLSKGNVSLAVESLRQKSLLEKTPDVEDRRKCHLSLTNHADQIIHDVERLQAEFEKQIFFGISEEEKAIFGRLNDRIRENTETALARRNE